MEEMRIDEQHSFYLETNSNTVADFMVGDDNHVCSMISAMASERPDAAAVISAEDTLSYGELDSLSNSLAQRLLAMQVGPENVVALWMTRSPWVIISALAAMKAGAAYLPLDPSNPCERLLFMVKDSGAKVVITDSASAEYASPACCPVLNIDAESAKLTALKGKEQAPDVALRPDGLAYVIYTSGSTGVPKGVEITHASLANLVSWHNRVFQVSSADRASHLAGLGFDATVWETWPYLAVGASLRLADPDTLNSPEQLHSWLLANGVTISFVPTPMAERMFNLGWPESTKLRMLLTGGDTLHTYPPHGLPFTVVNNYGPTECTVVSTWTIIPAGSNQPGLPPIGMPIDNSQVHLLTANLQPVTDGEDGEIYVGGVNVARGYRNRPDLTSERFIPNPFMAGSRLYRTGDLGRRLPNGQIAFLGRIDDQIKIRGYRIEPGEIAAAMNAYQTISASAVVADGDAENKRLVGYIVTNEEIARSQLQEFLLARLPEYMVPSQFVVLEALPLTINGKLDAAALPPPTPENTLHDTFEAPCSVLETSVAEIISELLQVSDVGPDDDFFLLGGHSLLGTQLIARVRDRFQVNILLRTLFEQPTIRGLATAIEQAQTEAAFDVCELPTPEEDSPTSFRRVA